MPSKSIITLQSVSQFVQYTESTGRLQFYRGQSEDWSLVPSIARVGNGGFEVLLDFEEMILSEFRRLSSPYIRKIPSSFSEWILHAQHHGLPTRLLDWTENPLKALYFAVEDKKNTNDGVVWGWDSFKVEWNEEFPNLDAEKLYFHRPSHLNDRIVAQQSMFLVYPLGPEQISIKPLDLFGLKNEGLVEKFIVPANKKALIRKQLDALGINVLSMFPSMGTAAALIRQEYFMDEADEPELPDV